MKRYWFKAKEYGYGWYPVTWQGWTITGTYVLFMVTSALAFKEQGMLLVLSLLGGTALMIYISYKTGEKAQWRWGTTILKKNKGGHNHVRVRRKF